MTKLNQLILVIRVVCDNYSGTHLTKDCDLDENGNKNAQVFYSSSDKYDEDWRNPRMSGCHMKSKKSRKMKSIDKPIGAFIKKINQHPKRRWISSQYFIDLWKLLKRGMMLLMLI